MCQANILKFSLFYQTLKVFQPLHGIVTLKNGTLTHLQCAFICCSETLMALSNAQTNTTASPDVPQSSPLVMRIIGAVALAHLINDLIQAVLPSIYPMLKANYDLTFTQIGLITLTFQLTASLLQPWVGYYTDRHPNPLLLPAGMICTLVGILMLSQVGSFPLILLAAGLVGIGSSTFHPEASRVARLASGGRYGLAQSTFQVGGNAGSAFGPLLAAAIIIPFGQGNVAWFGLFALFAVGLLYVISRWYRKQRKQTKPGNVALPKRNDDSGCQQWSKCRTCVTAHLKGRLRQAITPSRRQPRYPRGFGVKSRRADTDQCGR